MYRLRASLGNCVMNGNNNYGKRRVKTCHRKKIRNKWCRYAELRYRVRLANAARQANRYRYYSTTIQPPLLLSLCALLHVATGCCQYYSTGSKRVLPFAARFQTPNDTSQRELDDVRIILRNELWRVRKSFRLFDRIKFVETSRRQQDITYIPDYRNVFRTIANILIS